MSNELETAMDETIYLTDGVCIRCDGSGRAENDGEEGEHVPCLHCNGSGLEPSSAIRDVNADERAFPEPTGRFGPQ